jgi:hypothetical protein
MSDASFDARVSGASQAGAIILKHNRFSALNSVAHKSTDWPRQGNQRRRRASRSVGAHRRRPEELQLREWQILPIA